MIDFWRLDFINGDFLLVEAPVFKISKLVRAYHLELLSRVRGLPGYELAHSDPIIYSNLGQYYKETANLIKPNFDVNLLTVESRHKFFIAAQERNGSWISGLELLMGFDFVEESITSQKIRVTTNDFEVDLLAEILLLPRTNIKWLCNTFSANKIALLCKQVSDRTRGKEALDEIQREIDLKAFEEQGIKELEKIGFNFPEV